MNVKRIVNISLWDDELVIDKFSAEDKYFWLFLLTNKYTTQLGIYHFPIKKVAPDMGYSIETIYTLLDRFENKYGIIRFSQATNEVAILNYLRHSIVSGGKPVLDCLIRDAENVKDKSLLKAVINHLSNFEIKNNTVISFIKYINNDNDNDNEESYPDSYHDSYPESSGEQPKKKKEEPKIKFGAYGNVLLTNTEYERLANDYGADKRDKAIEYLDLYIGDKGYKSKSHNLALRRWVFDAVERDANNKKGNGNVRRNSSRRDDECTEDYTIPYKFYD